MISRRRWRRTLTRSWPTWRAAISTLAQNLPPSLTPDNRPFLVEINSCALEAWPGTGRLVIHPFLTSCNAPCLVPACGGSNSAPPILHWLLCSLSTVDHCTLQCPALCQSLCVCKTFLGLGAGGQSSRLIVVAIDEKG